ncbi:hypothetical protein Tco_0864063 [Tanacetum coccineum]
MLKYHYNQARKSFSNPIYGYFSRTNELPDNYCVFEVNYDGVFNEYPLRHEHRKNLTLKCILEEGLTILEGDGDMNKLYDIDEKYGLINLYIAHLLKNLAEYYFKILTLDASDEEVKSKLKSHEKRKPDACSMSPHKLVEWEQQEAADELVLDDNWQYEGLAVDDVRDKMSKNSKRMRLRKGCGKRVAIGGHGQVLGRLIGLNVDAVDDPQVMKQVSLPARSSNTECIPGAGDTYLPYNFSRVVADTSRTADRHHYLPPVVTCSSSCFLD